MRIEKAEKPKEILDYEKEIGIELVVSERDQVDIDFTGYRYYCDFPPMEITDGRFLKTSTGNGQTVDEAISSYCKAISFKNVVINAYSSTHRREFFVPNLVHTRKGE